MMDERPAVMIGIVAGLATAATAGSPTFFGDRGAFETAAAGAGVPLDGFESFEDFPASNTDFFDEVDGDGVTVTGQDLLDGFPFVLTIQDSMQNGLGPTDGSNYLSISSFDENELTLTFDNAVSAVGLDLIDFGDFAGVEGTIEGALDTGETFTIFDGAGSNGNTAFFGLINSNPFTQLVITNNFDGDQYGIDAVSFGVPTPGTAGLLALGGLAAARRRR